MRKPGNPGAWVFSHYTGIAPTLAQATPEYGKRPEPKLRAFDPAIRSEPTRIPDDSKMPLGLVRTLLAA